MKILVAALYDIPDRSAGTVDEDVVAQRVADKLAIPDGDVERVTVSVFDPPEPVRTNETELSPGGDASADPAGTIEDPTDPADGMPGPYG